MKTVLVGVGQAGGKLTTALASFDEEIGFGAVRDALAVNTASADLQSVPFETMLIGQDRVNGHGVGGDNELGAEIMQNDIDQVMTALGNRISAETESIFVVAGLGGGTGSGGAPVLAKRLSRVYDIPVYGLGVLPGSDEGALYQVNAGRSLKTLAREADAVLLIDNDAWKESGESMSEGYEAINQNIARRVGLLLAAGEATEGVAESVVDSSEIINTLRAGGIASLGYASTPAAEEAAENISVITSTTRNAMLTGSSLPGATDAEAALLIVAGQPERLSRKGVEKARKWVETETESMQVRGGDFPIDSSRLASLVLLGGVERSDRVQRFMTRAEQAAEEAAEIDQTAREADKTFQNDELDGLF
ncbi:MAG: tubulin/FtsZ family protein [Euryarchaeota archaeon]|nr:tubulin/FtsZ family protein [Euryarchaeota archaeon]